MALLLGLLGLSGCAASGALPPVRTVVSPAGQRLRPTAARMVEIDRWYRFQVLTIERDPSFLIAGQPADSANFPWENLTFTADTASIWVPAQYPDTYNPFNTYAHFKLMERRGQLSDWLPEGDALEGYELEREIVGRLSDTWLYGRAVFAAAPFEPLDKLVFSKENGYLDAFMFTFRGEEFSDERERWVTENPGRLEEYERWLDDAFGT